MDPSVFQSSPRLLSLDGGGIRALSELLVLRSIMESIQHLSNHAVIPRPCDYFDLIGGTSTGGLIAIMLGRLGMSIDESIQAYCALAAESFRKTHVASSQRVFGHSQFRSSNLRSALRRLVRGKLGNPEAKLLDLESGCKMFVCATSSNGIAETFSNFETAANVHADVAIWQAAMATLSVPMFFDPVEIGGTSYVNDIPSNSNPAARVISEARKLWPNAEDGCLISIGSFPRVVGASGAGNTAYILKRMAIAAAKAESKIRQDEFGPSSKMEYFRFTVDSSIDSSALEEWKDPSLPGQNIEHYLRSVKADIQTCTVKLVEISNTKQMNVGSGKSIVEDDEANIYRMKARGKFVNIPFARNTRFVGRSIEIEALRSDLEKEGRVVLQGLGGTGKTQIALEYAYRHSAKYNSVLWFNVGTLKSVLLSYTDIYRMIFPDNEHHKVSHLLEHDSDLDEEPSSESKAVMVRSFVERNSTKDWLLVFDNADDLESFDPTSFIPACGAHVIITTRRMLSIPGVKSIVAPMTEAEAVELLAQLTLGIPDRIGDLMLEDHAKEECNALVNQLGRLPLAIAMAGSYISQNAIKFRTYRALFETHSKELFAHESSRAVGYGESLFSTWEISFRALRGSTAQLFQTLAFLDKEIRLELLASSLAKIADFQFLDECDPLRKRLGWLRNGTESPFVFETAVSELCAYSLATRRGEDGISIHTLVHLWTRDRLALDAQRQTTVDAVVVTAQMSSVCMESPESWVLRRHTIPHIIACIRNIEDYLGPRPSDFFKGETITQLIPLSSALKDFGWLALAEKLLQWGFEAAEAASIPDEALLANLSGSLAEVLSEEGRYQEAEAMQRKVCQNNEMLFGLESPQHFSSIVALAETLMRSGKLSEACSFLETASESSVKIQGRSHLNTLAINANLGSAYHALGRYAESEALYEEVLNGYEERWGRNHVHTISVMHKLASLYVRQGRYKQAEELNTNLLETKRTFLGPEHPATLSSLRNLALIYQEQGRYQEAESLYRRVLEVTVKTVGRDHPNTMAIASELSSVYLSQERYKEAEELQTHILNDMERNLGREHPATVTTQSNLASTYRYQGRWKEAEDLEVQSIELSEKLLGSQHPDTLSSMANLALTYTEQGRLEEAEKLMTRVAESKKIVLGKDHPSTLSSIANLAMISTEQGRLDEAEQMALQVLKARETILGQAHPDTVASMTQLARIYTARGRSDEAEKLESRAAETRKKFSAGHHSNVLQA